MCTIKENQRPTEVKTVKANFMQNSCNRRKAVPYRTGLSYKYKRDKWGFIAKK